MTRQIIILLFSLLATVTLRGQAPPIYNNVYAADTVALPDSAAVGNLRLNANALLFIQDNEFSTPMVKGYTLPGFRLRLSVAYQATRNVSIEGGIYALRYWGTDEYPNLAYRDIAYWDGTGKSTKGFHLLPMLRATVATDFGLTVVLGTLYGGARHRLIEPMYAPELNLTADPEAGLQVMYDNPRVSVDAWVNWESFIYHGDTHQEAFVVGASGVFNYTRPSAPVRVYTPASLLLQHRGGEIDTIFHNSVQTVMNASIGVGASHDFGRKWLRTVSAEAHFLSYRQLTGELWPYDSGTACYLTASAQVGELEAHLGYFHADKFISLMGYPMFGTLASTSPQEVYGTSSTVIAGVNYAHTFAPGFSLGATLGLYHQPKATGLLPTGEINEHKVSNSLVVGVMMRVCPSWLLHKNK